jgi:hypothetical protein
MLDRKHTHHKPIASLQSPDCLGLISTCRNDCRSEKAAEEEKMQKASESTLAVLHTSLFDFA